MMGKYTYSRVESVRDIDLTGETQYYIFEEGLGHKEFKEEDFLWTNLRDLTLMVSDRTLFIREEKPWYKCIPEHGILCWVEGQGLRRILKSGERHVRLPQPNGSWIDEYKCACCESDTYTLSSCTPLTNEEIEQFLTEED